MSNPSSRLDLTGQASEDEPASQALHLEMAPTSSRRAEQKNEQERRPQSELTTATGRRNDSRTANNSDDGGGDASARRPGGTLTRYVPNPIDLWQSRTLPSLLLLPFAVMIYIVLQLPLHYGSAADKDTWKGRVRDVDKLSKDLTVVEKNLHEVKEEHYEIKDEVRDLRRRLNKMKDRRREREEEGRVRREVERRREEEEIKELWRKQLEREEEERRRQEQGALGGEGPIASVTMVKAMAVATFAGGKKPSVNVDDSKKGD